jgi:hypothetical protein
MTCAGKRYSVDLSCGASRERSDQQLRGSDVMRLTVVIEQNDQCDRSTNTIARSQCCAPLSHRGTARPLRSRESEKQMPPYTVVTTEPPTPPPLLYCPSCDRSLRYRCSYLSGTVRHPEQWDDYICESCGTFQYRQRTRRLRRVGQDNVDANQTQQRRRTSRTC